MGIQSRHVLLPANTGASGSNLYTYDPQGDLA
jgi:hypothetical protein